MKTYTLLSLIILLLIGSGATAQTNDVKAQSAYLQAYEAYQKRMFTDAANHLNTARDLLGKTNSKIQYLLVKSLIEAKDHRKADLELKKYFEITPESARDERYEEMVKNVAVVEQMRVNEDKRLAEQKAAIETEKERQNQLLVNEINFVESQIKQNSRRSTGKVVKGILAIGAAGGIVYLMAKDTESAKGGDIVIASLTGFALYLGGMMSFLNAGKLGKENRRLKTQLNQLRSVNKLTVLPAYNPMNGSVGISARIRF